MKLVLSENYEEIMDQEEENVERNEEDGSESNPDPCLHDDADLPTSLIVTNLDVRVFNDEQERIKFEEMFREFDRDITVQYFKSFRRVRVNFSCSSKAACARIQLHQASFCDRCINCYFAQAVTPKGDVTDVFLHPPAPVKQFLISPPASPPVGWEPVGEAQPVINYDLLAAIAKLTPGEAHELHPPSETQPGIVVHICEEEEKAKQQLGACLRPAVDPKPKIVHTRRPERETQ